ncbi:hypothetical protein [uncultured Tissierella sp.]|uniref:hypothetical protein n=1 Tax=uncultured Tissierella sp. TaxID=448160 RepID=UPI0028057E69|nr:hypothetical protein [uncultured Tissierella sp.]MDU5081227.1 hypothetical protein [Bacillota bacterium]
MQIIRYYEMEKLLGSYRDIEGAIECIKHELCELERGIDDTDVDDFIESLALKRVAFDGVKVRVEGHISDKTASTALNYRKKLEQENNQLLYKLREELFILQMVLDKINIGFRALPGEAREVIMYKYFEDLTWGDIEHKLYITKHRGTNIRKKGIERLCAICRITIKQYEEIMKLLKLQ